MGAILSLSLVTVCMNRREHLMRSVAAVAAWPHHHQFLMTREPFDALGCFNERIRRILGLATIRGSRRSRYQEIQPVLWCLEPGSQPKPPTNTADEIDHARRMAFWDYFLIIPDSFLERLPIKLVPLDRHGVWPVHWWHRLHWHPGWRLLELLVWLLSRGRGRLQGIRRVIGRSP